jgi:hypothetical protein
MQVTTTRRAMGGAAFVGLILGLFAVPIAAQGPDHAALLVATRWCNESTTGLSFQTIKLRFQPDGVLLLRKDTELANGSHNGSNFSGRWELEPGMLIIHEPNGGQSRLPLIVSGAGASTRISLGGQSYAPCR